MSRTNELADRTALHYSAVSLMVQADEQTLGLIRQYALVYAQYQMSRVSAELQRRGYTSAARAVDTQYDIIEALDRAS